MWSGTDSSDATAGQSRYPSWIGAGRDHNRKGLQGQDRCLVHGHIDSFVYQKREGVLQLKSEFMYWSGSAVGVSAGCTVPIRCCQGD